MKKLLLILRTVAYLRPVQVVNRLWRKRAIGAVREAPVPPRAGLAPRVAWPTYFSCWDGGGQFTFLSETFPCVTAADWNAAARKKLWLYNLHYFDCLRTAEGAADVTRACALIRRWIAENPVGRGNGWEPYPISLRVVNWIKWLTVNREKIGAASSAIDQSLAVQVRYLAKRLEYHLLANHLLANAKALVFAGLAFTGDEAAGWLKKGLALYRAQLPEQVLADGVHFELSAMYHSIMLEDVLDCVNLARGAAHEEAAFLNDFAERMMAALDLLVGPDGAIVKFNDAADGIALAPATLTAYAAALGFTPPPVPQSAAGSARDGRSGFVKLVAGEWTLFVKCGAIGPSYQPGHAHADSLGFELWKGTQKIVADTGTDRYVVDDERKRQRGSAAHNVVVVNGRNSSEVWSGHRVAARAKILGWQVKPTVDGAILEASLRDVAGNTWRRTLALTPNGLEGQDEVTGRLRTVEARFHFVPNATQRVELVLDRQLKNSGRADCGLAWEPCELAATFGRMVPGTCGVIKGDCSLGAPVTLAWRISERRTNG